MASRQLPFHDFLFNYLCSVLVERFDIQKNLKLYLMLYSLYSTNLLCKVSPAEIFRSIKLISLSEQGVERLARTQRGVGVRGDGERRDKRHLQTGVCTRGGLVEAIRVLKVLS